MAEFTINGVEYRSGKLTAFTQFHIVRRLTPCLGKLSALASSGVKLQFDAEGKVSDMDGDISKVLTPLGEALAVLKDEDVEYVLNACLSVTRRKRAGGGAWTLLRVDGTPMFDDLSLPLMLQIAWHVIRENIQDFFSELPQLSSLLEGLKSQASPG
jgi:hypothetical protein